MNKIQQLLLLCLLPGVSSALHSQEAGRETRLTLHTTVTGNREQPRVMYIVPWDQPGEATMEHTFQHSIASELFVPVDREEFVRSTAYQKRLNITKQGEDHGEL